MGALRTVSLCLILAATARPAAAQALSAADIARAFAACAGRLSAETEHLWSFDIVAAEEAARRRDLFVGLVEAAGTAPDRAMGWRVDAKMAQRQLLETATYAGGSRAARAARLARRERAACDGLLLGL